MRLDFFAGLLSVAQLAQAAVLLQSNPDGYELVNDQDGTVLA